MDVLDFIVFFIWVLIFHLYFSYRRRKYEHPILKKYHRRGFWFKVIASMAYSMFVLYISPGDTTTLYYPEGLNFYKTILDDPSQIKILFTPASFFDPNVLSDFRNAGYFDEESNFMVTRCVAFFSFFTFGKFLAINLFFSMVAFTGMWRLYRFFYDAYPHLHKHFAWAIVYLPTFVFWSSGILKDSLCVAALGWLTYSMNAIFYEKKSILKNCFNLFLSISILYIVKVYILVSYLPLFVLFLILRNLKMVQNKLYRTMLVLVFLSISIVAFLNLGETMQSTIGDFAGEGLTESIKTYQNIYAHQAKTVESNFSLGIEFDGSVQSLIKMAPAAIVATFYRPFLWESKKLSTLMSSTESLVLMLFTLYVIFKLGLFRFMVTIFRSPMIMYCFLFALIFGLFVGATTLNFGSLVRYKIPAMPFYIIALVLMLDFHGKIRKKENPEPTSGI